jgi:hypothetical protein
MTATVPNEFPVSRARTLSWLLIAGSLCLAGLVALDTVSVRGRVLARDPWSDRFFLRFEPAPPLRGPRVGGAAAQLDIPGLGARQQVRVGLRLASAASSPFDATVWANEAPLSHGRARSRLGDIEGMATADRDGRIRIRFSGAPVGEEASVRVASFWVRSDAPASVPTRRLLAYAVWLALAAALSAWVCRRLVLQVAGVFGAAAALGAALVAARLPALALLPDLVTALAAALVMGLCCSQLLRIEPLWAKWIVVAFGLRLVFATQPAFPSIDSFFHLHRTEAFWEGGVISNRAPGPVKSMPIPYPPAFYVPLGVVYQVVGWPEGEDDRLVRLGMIIVESTAPLLLFGLMRVGGASVRASSIGAAMLAAAPEGILVLGKGIAANTFGNWAALIAFTTIVGAWGFTATAVSMALPLLSHLGVALTFAATVALWVAHGLRSGRELRPHVLRVAFALPVAAVLAWFAYYHDVWGLLRGAMGTTVTQATHVANDYFGVRWLRIGKVLQDLLLKFGGGPLVLAVYGYARGSVSPSLRRLLSPWLLASAATAIVAFLTPFSLRFEYFALPAVAVLAGVGGDALLERRRGALVHASLALAFAVQVGLALALLYGVFHPDDAMLASPHWRLADWLGMPRS